MSIKDSPAFLWCNLFRAGAKCCLHQGGHVHTTLLRMFSVEDRDKWRLEHQKPRSNLIEVYKHMIGIDTVDGRIYFPECKCQNSTGYMFKVRGEQFKEVL